MLTYAFFLSNRRESLVRAFRKKTPLSVRRPGGGGLRGVRKVSLETWLFFIDGFPKSSLVSKENLKLEPMHYWLRWSIGFWNVQKVAKSRHLFLIQ